MQTSEVLAQTKMAMTSLSDTILCNPLCMCALLLTKMLLRGMSVPGKGLIYGIYKQLLQLQKQKDNII